jgi:hypothetical protein
MMRPSPIAFGLLLALVSAAPLRAQTLPPAETVRPAQSVDATLADLRKLVERQQGLLETQAKRARMPARCTRLSRPA